MGAYEESIGDGVINKELIKEAVREVLIESGYVMNDRPDRRYYPTSQAWRVLGYRNPAQLYEAVKSGLFRMGIEVQDRRRPRSMIARWYFDVERCEKRLNEKPERRKCK